MGVSLKRPFYWATGVCFAAGIACGGFLLHNLSEVKRQAVTQVVSGKRPVQSLENLEMRVRGVSTLAGPSVATKAGREEFGEAMNTVLHEIEKISAETPRAELAEAKRQARKITEGEKGTSEELFVHYRNLKAALFSLYRASHFMKRTDLARGFSSMIGELDSVPPQSARKAVSSIQGRADQVEKFTHSIGMVGGANSPFLANLKNLQTETAAYLELHESLDSIRAKREDDLKSLDSMLKGATRKLSEEEFDPAIFSRRMIFRSVAAVLGLLIFYVFWMLGTGIWFSMNLEEFGQAIKAKLAKWFSPTGVLNSDPVVRETPGSSEIRTAFEAIDSTFERLTSLRKEDTLIRRLLTSPILVIDRHKKAVFWNAAFTKLAKIRAFEESGQMEYARLLPAEPVERCFNEKTEINRFISFRAGDEEIGLEVDCTPVMDARGELEYVIVNVRQKVESVLEAERGNMILGQLQTLKERVIREGALKQNVYRRMEQLQEDSAPMLRSFARSQEMVLEMAKVFERTSRAYQVQARITDKMIGWLTAEGMETMKPVVELLSKSREAIAAGMRDLDSVSFGEMTEQAEQSAGQVEEHFGKVQRMLEIGKASAALQSQLEELFHSVINLLQTPTGAKAPPSAPTLKAFRSSPEPTLQARVS